MRKMGPAHKELREGESEDELASQQTKDGHDVNANVCVSYSSTTGKGLEENEEGFLQEGSFDGQQKSARSLSWAE